MDQVHRFIWRLLTDEEFRKLALSDTATALGQFQFSASEQGALRRLCKRLSLGEDPLAQQIAYATFWWQ